MPRRLCGRLHGLGAPHQSAAPEQPVFGGTAYTRRGEAVFPGAGTHSKQAGLSWPKQASEGWAAAQAAAGLRRARDSNEALTKLARDEERSWCSRW